MNITRFEPKSAAPPSDEGPPVPRTDPPVRAEAQAAEVRTQENRVPDETIDEPGYGHGV